MMKILRIIFYLSLLCFGFTSALYSQPWNFVKEKDGIKIYTRLEANNSLKSFKGETVFKASIEKVCAMLGNARNKDWWDKNMSDIKVLGFEENKFIQYYLIYNMPWPITNRDLVADTRITSDPLTGVWTFTAGPLANVIPEEQDLVRIKNYHQKWTVQPLDKGKVRVMLEGFIDPGGNVPAWVYNMLVPETPFKAIHSLRERVLSKKPAKP